MRKRDNQVLLMLSNGLMKAKCGGRNKRQLIMQQVTSANCSARSRGLSCSLTATEWEQALVFFGNRCAVCGRNVTHISGVILSMDHWLPLSYEGDDNPGSVIQNVIPLCCGKGGCNNLKSSIMPEIWLERRYGKYRAQWILKRIQKYFDSLQ